MPQASRIISAALLVASCSGSVEPAPRTPPRAGGAAPGASADQGPPPSMTPNMPAQVSAQACSPTSPASLGEAPLRRLTRSQYANTVRDLFGKALPAGAALPIAARFPADERVGPFTANPLAAVSDAHGRLYMAAAEELAALVTRPEVIAGLLPCMPTRGTEATCAEQFIRTFGRRAFRRPLTPDMVAALRTLYTLGAQNGGWAAGIRLVVSAVLQAPDFLYHVELKPQMATPAPIDGFEAAARLSYFLWDSLPDDTLLTAAEAGKLASPEGLRAEAQRLLADARARDAIDRFATDWLGLDGLEAMTRDTRLYPAFVPGLPAAMQTETLEFVDQVLRKGDGLASTLMTGAFSFPSDPLFRVYGVNKPLFYSNTRPLPLPKDQRAGVLTHPSVLAVTSHTDHTSPVKRGIFVLSHVLCHEIAFPEGLEIPPLPDPDPNKTTRQRFAQHVEQPACAACHKIIDPLGFALERYDPIGVYRTSEGGKPLDDTGTISVGDAGLDGPVRGGVELATKIAGSGKARSCFVRQGLRFAHGRLESPADACTLARLESAFARSNHNLRELMLAIAADESFRLRPSTTP